MGSGRIPRRRLIACQNFVTILAILYLYMYIYRDNLSNEGSVRFQICPTSADLCGSGG